MNLGYVVGAGLIVMGLGVLCWAYGHSLADTGLKRASLIVFALGLLLFVGPMIANDWDCALEGGNLIEGRCEPLPVWEDTP